MKQFVCYDGDDIGRKLQKLFISNDLIGAIEYSGKVTEAMIKIREQLEAAGLICKFFAGDSMVFVGPKNICEGDLPISVGEISFSVGIGSNLRCAGVALFKAKSLGRGRVEVGK